MSTGARIFFVGSLVLTGLTVFTVNYYIDEEKKVVILFRKRSNIYVDISRREERHKSNMEQYEKQLKIQEKLLSRDK
ncbi:unnamed protein product [Rotaria sp. Silwood1]|nr:unnamed protein product [Rotaria sp. Silwood1]CAF1265014.1 unnamed protein product [Rotaria sp. Silwood1]CAF5028081.1 unnamed protein product [Rotaria sp. Silwood1]